MKKKISLLFTVLFLNVSYTPYSSGSGFIADDIALCLVMNTEKNAISGHQVAYVASYSDFSRQLCHSTIINLSHLCDEGHERYIVIQSLDRLEGPACIRAHALLDNSEYLKEHNSGGYNNDIHGVNIRLTDATFADGSSHQCGNAHLHTGDNNLITYSPDNFHLNLPSTLNENEHLSFVSNIECHGRSIDTLHVLTSSHETIYQELKRIENIENHSHLDIMAHLEEIRIHPSFNQYKLNIMSFIMESPFAIQ